MNANRHLPVSFARGVLLLLIALSLQALGEQIARSAQAWTLRSLLRPAVFGLEAALWSVLFALSFSSQGKRLFGLVERAVGKLVAWKRWNWAVILALVGLYSMSRLSPAAALIERFFPHLWLWGHIVLLGTLFLWAAQPGWPLLRLLICIVTGIALWQVVTLASAELNQPKPPFVVVYLGGSITAGDGASDPEQTSWRALTSAWLQEQYPKYEVVSINAGMPGTGSDLGVFRSQEQVLEQEPNLVLIEFAVNDSVLTETVSMRAMEGIVRKIRINRPATHIFFVYTTTLEQSAAYERGDTPPAVLWHERVAQHYEIPTIQAGMALWQEIAAGRATWEDLTVDGVHPRDQGYAVYFEAVRAALQATQLDAGRPSLSLPPPILKPTLENARIIPASQLEAPGWELTEKIFAYPFPQALESNQAGATLTYHFKGHTVGIYWRADADAGQISWAVDSMAEQTANCWRATGMNTGRIFAWDLGSGEHELRLRILPPQPPESSKKWIRILGLLVDEE